jgi:hypothetical protein
MVVALVGIGTVIVVVLGAMLLVRFARRNALDEEAPPPSRGADFVAPVSSGQYRFRAPDESPEQFKARVDAENDEIASSKRGAELAPERASQSSNERGGSSS